LGGGNVLPKEGEGLSGEYVQRGKVHSVRQVEAPYSGEIVNKGKARSPERQLATYLHCNPCVSGLKTLKKQL